MTDHNHNREHDSSERGGEREEYSPAQSPVEVLRSAYNTEDTPTAAVLLAVSAVEGVRPTEMEPIYESVDPGALNTLLEGPAVIGDAGTISIEFRYLGYRVRVRNSGSITILEPEE
jgi:hypothetical protein